MRRTLARVNEQFNISLAKLQEQYREALEELLKEYCLDSDVVNIVDGQEGVLVIERNLSRQLGYELKFYPITKTGKLSKRAIGCFCLQNFKPNLPEYTKQRARSNEIVIPYT